MNRRHKLTYKRLKEHLTKFPAKSIRMRELGGMKLEVLSVVPGESFVSLGYIQLPKKE